jgi:hypothetical protein
MYFKRKLVIEIDMSSKKRHEGYLLIDNRFGPGVSEEFARASGKECVNVGEGRMYESATVTCSHCHTVVVLRPDRSRERGYCRKCDHYICDNCTTVMAKTFTCRPLNAVIDDLRELAVKSPDSPLILLP